MISAANLKTADHLFKLIKERLLDFLANSVTQLKQMRRHESLQIYLVNVLVNT